MVKDLKKQNAVMQAYLQSLPAQVTGGYSLGGALKLPARYKSVKQLLFCGVGGSAIGMDILAQVMKESSRIPFSVHRGEELPRWVSSETLVVLTSYSGDTRETLSAFREALSRSAPVLAVTSGGSLARKAAEKNIPTVLIPSGMPPRTAVGYLTFALAGALAQGGWLRCSKKETSQVRDTMGRFILKAPSLAKQLRDRMIFLYGESAVFEVVMKRWRAQFAENAKTLSSHHGSPEMFHNEIEGWRFPGFLPRKSAVVFFRSPEESKDVKKKTDFAVKHIQASGAKVVKILSPKGSMFGKIFSLIALGDWVSFELARLCKVDPVVIPAIKKIKEAC